MSGRENFAGSVGAVMAMAGSAIGLGNIWRFPYMAGQNGGAAFIIIYLLCVVFLSLPIMLSETIIGRSSHSNAFGAMEKIAPGTGWKWMGLLTVISPLIILSFYSVVGGWSIGFAVKSLYPGFDNSVSSVFGEFSSSAWKPLICHTIFLLVTAVVVKAGIRNGIEKFNKYSLPLLFVLIVLIAVYSLSLPGSEEGVKYLVKPDFSQVTSKTVAYAMGQSFFSLSLGVGTILTYSSYIKKDTDILKASASTAAFDMLFALIAGFAVMPAVFAAGIEPGAGPGLIFETLPFIFVKMSAISPVLSHIVAVLFFLSITIAALTSSISMYEVGTAYLVEEKHMSRNKAVAVIFAFTWILGILCSLSLGPLSGLKIAGLCIFDFCDVLTSNYLMTFGALLYVVFVGWKMKRQTVWDDFTNGGRQDINVKVFKPLYFLIRYVAPIVVILIFLSNLTL